MSERTNANTSEWANAHMSEWANAHTNERANARTIERANARTYRMTPNDSLQRVTPRQRVIYNACDTKKYPIEY